MTDTKAAHRPTEPEDDHTPQTARRARSARRVGVGILALIVLAAMTGILGPRTGQVRAEGGGYKVAVTYPMVTRPGLDVRMEVLVENVSGFGKTLTIALSRHYFDIFDLNSLRPDPDSVTSTGDSLIYSWDSPPSERFQFSLDMGAEYGEHLGLDGFASVLQDGIPVVTARFHTRLVP